MDVWVYLGIAIDLMGSCIKRLVHFFVLNYLFNEFIVKDRKFIDSDTDCTYAIE